VVADDDLYMGEALEPARVAARPIDTQRPAPIVHDQGYVVRYAEGPEGAVDEFLMLAEGIGIGPRCRQLIGIPLADIVDGDQPPCAF
jgi:hypothetical protein